MGIIIGEAESTILRVSKNWKIQDIISSLKMNTKIIGARIFNGLYYSCEMTGNFNFNNKQLMQINIY